MKALARDLFALAFALSIGCSPDVAAQRRSAARLLDAAEYDSARSVVSALSRRCPNDTSVLALETRLFSAERRVREATDALWLHDSLAGTHDPALMVQVLGAVLGDGDKGCIMNTIRACGELAAEPMYGPVESALNDHDPDVRRAAVYAIPRYHHDDAVDALASEILDDEPMVRAEMLQSAARLGEKRMLDLTRVLQLDDNDAVIWYFINMRAALGDRRMQTRLHAELGQVCDILKVDAAATLARLGEMEQLPVLTAAMRADDEAVRANAARALGDLRSDVYIDTLLAAAADKSEYVRQEVAYALGETDDARAVPTLQRFVHDGNPRVRASAIVALARLRQPEATIAPALRDSSLTVRAAAVTALLAVQQAGQSAK